MVGGGAGGWVLAAPPSRLPGEAHGEMKPSRDIFLHGLAGCALIPSRFLKKRKKIESNDSDCTTSRD